MKADTAYVVRTMNAYAVTEHERLAGVQQNLLVNKGVWRRTDQQTDKIVWEVIINLLLAVQLALQLMKNVPEQTYIHMYLPVWALSAIQYCWNFTATCTRYCTSYCTSHMH